MAAKSVTPELSSNYLYFIWSLYVQVYTCHSSFHNYDQRIHAVKLSHQKEGCLKKQEKQPQSSFQEQVSDPRHQGEGCQGILGSRPMTVSRERNGTRWVKPANYWRLDRLTQDFSHRTQQWMPSYKKRWYTSIANRLNVVTIRAMSS